MDVVHLTGSGVALEVDIKHNKSFVEQRERGAEGRGRGKAIAVSIVSNSRLLSDGLFALLATRMVLLPVAHYGASMLLEQPQEKLLPNPSGHVVLIDGNVGQQMAQMWSRYWRSAAPPAHVLLLEMADDAESIVDCIAAGAGGYLLQGQTVDDVVQAIGEVQQGTATCSPEVTGQLCARLMSAQQIIGGLSLTESPLTPRELEVLHCIEQNLSNQEIANLLVIEVRTVKHHVHNILEKLQLHNRREAAQLAAKQGWLQSH